MNLNSNSVSSNKIVLNIQIPQGGEMPLNKGEVLSAQVQEVGEDGRVTIMVKGKLIEATAEVMVKPGQQLLLLVDDVRNGKTYLRVVTPEMTGKIENTNITAHLLDMGIAAREDIIRLARQLLKYNLPVNPGNLNELNKNITLLGNLNDRNAEIAAFALSRGITGSTALQSLAQFLTPSTDMAKLLPILSSILESLAVIKADQAEAGSDALSRTTKQTGEGGAAALKTPLDTLGKIAGLPGSPPQSLADNASGTIKGQQSQTAQNPSLSANVANNQIKTDPSTEQTVIGKADSSHEPKIQTGTPTFIQKPENDTRENLTQSKPMGSVSPETSVKTSQVVSASKTGESTPRVPLNQAQMTMGEGNPVPSGILGTDEEIQGAQRITAAGLLPEEGSEVMSPRNPLNRSIINLLDALRSVLEINPDDPPDKIALKIQSSVLGEKDILRAFNLLKEISDNKEIVAKLPQLKEFTQRLNSLEKEITGQQLYNVSNKHSSENISSFYFSFPVPLDQGYGLCQLKISKDGRQRLRDVDDLSLVVSLDTNILGVVLFHIRWQKKGQLELQGVVENQATCNYLNQNAQQLVESLEALGYQVNHKGVRMSRSPEEVHSLKPMLQEITKPLRLGIDVTV